MKTLLLFILATMPLAALSQNTSANPRLTGIVAIEKLKLAIIQTPPPRSLELTLSEGQREGDMEVVTIASTNRSVAVRFFTDAQLPPLTLGNTDTTNHGPGIVLEEVSLQTVLNLFLVFSDRVILQHPRLPEVRFSLVNSVTKRDEAAQILKRALSEKRIAVVPDGSKFLRVAPEEMISAINSNSVAIPTTNANAMIPPGSINFSGAPLGAVLMIYAELLGGKLDRTTPLPRDGKVSFKMQTALSKEECLYALETLVGWHGIKLVSTGTGLFKAVLTD